MPRLSSIRQRGIYLYIESTSGPTGKTFVTHAPSQRLEQFEPGASRKGELGALGKTSQAMRKSASRRSERPRPPSTRT